MKKIKSGRDIRLQQELKVLHAYQRHFGSTNQREAAAAELGMDLETFRAVLEEARLHGFDIERRPADA